MLNIINVSLMIVLLLAVGIGYLLGRVCRKIYQEMQRDSMDEIQQGFDKGWLSAMEWVMTTDDETLAIAREAYNDYHTIPEYVEKKCSSLLR